MRYTAILAGLIATIPVAWRDDVSETPDGQYRRLAADYELAVGASSDRPIRKRQAKAGKRLAGKLPIPATTRPASSSWPKIIPNCRPHWTRWAGSSGMCKMAPKSKRLS